MDQFSKTKKAKGPPSSGFLKIPLEIRDEIYRILLTTPHHTRICYVPTESSRYLTKGSGVSLKFHLKTAILRVNKQLSAESRRVLYEENHFIILKVTGIFSNFEEIPVFHYLSNDRLPSPLLHVKIDVADESRRSTYEKTCITTSDGLQAIINAVWNLGRSSLRDLFLARMSHGDLKVSLNFNSKADDGTARQKDLCNLVLKPRENVHKVKELELSGDIPMFMVEHLQTSRVRGLFSSQITESFAKYQSLAEQIYRQEDYTAALWWWNTSGYYWHYLNSVRYSLVESDRSLWRDPRFSLPVYYQWRLGLGKTYLRRSGYKDVSAKLDCMYSYMDIAPLWQNAKIEFKTHVTPVMRMKLYLCGALARTALEGPAAGMKILQIAAQTYIKAADTMIEARPNF